MAEAKNAPRHDIAGRAVRRAAMSLAPIALAGCGVTPPPRTAMAVPPAFNDHPSVTLSETSTVRTAWWASFASPELDALERRALADNPDLAAASARIAEAQGGADIARAPLLPAIDVQGDARSRVAGGFGARSSIAAVASYEIDFWGRNRAGAASARALVEAARFDRETVAITLTASVADSYFAIRALRTRLDLARRIAADARRTLTLVEAQRQVGTGSDLQVQLQRNLLAGFEQSAAALERQIEQEQHALAILVGAPPEGFAAAPADAPEPATPVIGADAPLALLTRRPDIAAAEARLAAADLDVVAARRAVLPGVTLGAIAGLLLSPTTGAAVASGGLAQPLFHGGALRGAVRRNRARAGELTATYHATVLAALRDVEDALSAQAWLAREDGISDTAVASASRAAMLAEAQYRLGASDYLTVLTAERARYLAEDGKAQLHAQRLQAAVALFRALGGGFSREVR